MYDSIVLLYFYILIYSASNGCMCVSINSVQSVSSVIWYSGQSWVCEQFQGKIGQIVE